MPGGRWWCQLAWLGGADATAGVLLEAGPDGRLSAVTPGVDRLAAARAGAVILGGLTLPGLVNAHSHAFHRALRAWTQIGDGTFWTWRERMYAVAARLDPDRYRQLATAVYAEMARAGITTVGEFHYLHHQPDGRPYPAGDEMADALMSAAETAGVRLTLLDTCYLTGGIGRPLEGAQRRFSDGDADRWAARVERLRPTPTVRIGAAVHSVRAVPPASIATVAGWARHRGTVLHAHVSEQPAENDACQAAYGKTPTRHLADLGAAGAGFVAVHATHLQPDDIALLGSTGAGVCLCPTTERDLADGIGPAAGLAGAGAVLSLGSDSHAVIDLLEEARAVELDERLATGRRGGHPPARLLAAATAGGATALGWDDAGALAAGRHADFCTLDTGSVRLAATLGPSGEGAAAAAVFAAGAADVTDVVVA
ncbi:MAG TPA: formimidoylglutamate deiminase, partial [Acidimicrobiales bacterium]|nr:formimidoylglutamate deiminase [Acidimicrobiales bacterium]